MVAQSKTPGDHQSDYNSQICELSWVSFELVSRYLTQNHKPDAGIRGNVMGSPNQ